MTDEKWVKVAMNDDTLVVDILLRLHQATDHQLPPRILKKSTKSTPLHLDWTVRQRRSNSGLKIKSEGTRASPTTPLSFSGGTSVSGGAVEGFEESSRRSKIAATSETTTNTTAKRSKKKKTLAELREEENSLLKERRNLKNKLMTLHLTLEKHRATNESLKRLKLDYESPENMHTPLHTPMTRITSEESISQPHQMEPSCACTTLPSNKFLEVGSKEIPRVLPDLNLPIEEEPNAEVS